MIDFTASQWDRVAAAYQGYWDGSLDRPVVGVELIGRDPGRPCPNVPRLSQGSCHRFDIPADALVDQMDWDLSRRVFLGDAFPCISMDTFGPGVVSAFSGATLDNSTGNVWFHPPEGITEETPIEQVHITYDPNNRWVQRIKDIYRAGQERWGDSVAFTLPDLGGNLDIVQTFRPGERLLLDLFDSPEQVQRLLAEAHDAWWAAFEDFNATLMPTNRTCCTWLPFISDAPHYMLQCDFAYMISPAMFREFVLPELAATCGRLSRSIYHLDGVGQLPHLDMLLELDTLDGVQWIPGDGKAPLREWPDVFRRIQQAGKRIQLCGSTQEDLEPILDALGNAKGVHASSPRMPIEQQDDALEFLRRVNVPA